MMNSSRKVLVDNVAHRGVDGRYGERQQLAADGTARRPLAAATCTPAPTISCEASPRVRLSPMQARRPAGAACKASRLKLPAVVARLNF